MNTNSGNDPMLSSIITDDFVKFSVATSATVISTPSFTTSFYSTPAYIISMDGCLSPESHSTLPDLAAMWSSERKRVMSIKAEEVDTFSMSSYTPSREIDNGDIDMGDIDIENNSATVTEIKSEIEDSEYEDTHAADMITGSENCKREINTLSESEARRYVEEQFEKIALFPLSKLSQREKIEFILAKSDCAEFSVENILNFDKRSPDSARACARIVQNIPQRYRWECVMPEDIPCCYTIVADCKKVSSRDKPPRPMNAFMIWAQGARRLINELCPKMQNALISEALGYYWRQKSEAFKNNFEQEKIKLRRFHNAEFPEYKYKPKTKVQKAKEKQELSLNKAKLRASVKREKLQLIDESNPDHRRTKCGRPRKVKPVSGRKELNKPSPFHTVISEQSSCTPSSKPAIKDMLTLKILGDKRSKGARKNLTDSNVSLISAFGQLSPLEMDSSYVSDIFDDLGNFNMVVVGGADIDKDNTSKFTSSSVYDTPANTPPVDVDDELRLSPVQPQLTISLPTTVTSSQYNSSSLSIHTSHNKMLIPSISANQIYPTSTTSSSRNDHILSFGDYFNKTAPFPTNLQPLTVSTNQVLESTDMLLTYVTEALSSAAMRSHIKSNSTINSNANISNLDINRHSDDNNNNIDMPLCYSANLLNLKNLSSFSESSDLDTLSLDLNGPILSDDDMRCLLNTL